MVVYNNNTHIFADLDHSNELQLGDGCGHQAALDHVINPEVTQIVNSQFFADTVRADEDLQIRDGDRLTLHIDAHHLGVSNRRTGATKRFDITGDPHTSALRKATDLWQQHLAQCQPHDGAMSLTSAVAPLPDDETLREQAERIEALQEQIAQMVPASELEEAQARATASDERLAALQEEQRRLQGLLDTAPTTDDLATLGRERAEATARADDLEQKLAEAPSPDALEGLQRQLEAAIADQARLQEKLDELPTAGDLEERERLLAENEQAVERALAATKGLVDRNDVLARENAQMREQVRVTNDGAEALTERIRDLEDAAAKASEDSERLEGELLAEQEHLAEAVDALRAAQDETGRERQARLDDAHRHQRNIARLEAEKGKIHRWYTNAAAEASSLKRDLAEQTALRSQAERSAQTAQTTAARDRKAYDQVHGRNLALAAEARDARDESKALAGRVEFLETELDDLNVENSELTVLTDQALSDIQEQLDEADHLRAQLREQEAQAEKVAEAAQRRIEEERAALEEAQRLEAVSRAATPPPAVPVAATLPKAESSDEDELGALVGALGELNSTLEGDSDDAAQPPINFQIPRRFQEAMAANRDLLNLGAIDEKKKLTSTDNKLNKRYEEGAGIIRKNDPTGRPGTPYNAWRKSTFARLHRFFDELQAGLGRLSGSTSGLGYPRLLGDLLLHADFPYFARELLAYENLLQKVAALPEQRRTEHGELAKTLIMVRQLRVELAQLVNTVATRAEYV